MTRRLFWWMGPALAVWSLTTYAWFTVGPQVLVIWLLLTVVGAALVFLEAGIRRQPEPLVWEPSDPDRHDAAVEEFLQKLRAENGVVPTEPDESLERDPDAPTEFGHCLPFPIPDEWEGDHDGWDGHDEEFDAFVAGWHDVREDVLPIPAATATPSWEEDRVCLRCRVRLATVSVAECDTCAALPWDDTDLRMLAERTARLFEEQHRLAAGW